MVETTPYPIPRQARQTDVLVGNGGSVYGPFAFKIFDIEDVEVLVRPEGDDSFSAASVVVTKVYGLDFDVFTVMFGAGIPASTEFLVRSVRIAERSAGVKSGTRLDATAMEKEFSKIATGLQELRRDVELAVKVEFGGDDGLTISSTLEDGDLLMKQGDLLVKGPNAADLQAVAELLANAPDLFVPMLNRLSYDMISAFDNMSPSLAAAVYHSEVTAADAAEITTKLGEVLDGFPATGGVLNIPAGRYFFDPAHGHMLDVGMYGDGTDAELHAALLLPYKVRLRTAGTMSDFRFVNLSATSVGIAIGEDGIHNAGHSQMRYCGDMLTVRAIGSHGRYGVVTPYGADLFDDKRPAYDLRFKFAGITDDVTIVPHGWSVGLLLGDHRGGDIKLFGYGTYNPTLADTGQHQSTLLKISAEKGAYGTNIWFVADTWRTFVDIGSGLEGFQLSGEGQGGRYGVDFTSVGSEPGGNLGYLHLNVAKAAVRVLNRTDLFVNKLQAYRAPSYYDHGEDWSALEVVNSDIDVLDLQVNHADAPNTRVASAGAGNEALYNVNSRMARTDSASRVTINKWRTRSVPVVWTVNGSVDCTAGPGAVNGANTIFELKGTVNDFTGGNVTVENVAPTNYFTAEATVDRARLNFPRQTSIQTNRHIELTPSAAGSFTVKPRLTASDIQVVMGVGAGPHTFDIILDHDSAIDGDQADIKIVGSSSPNQTLRVISGPGGTVLSSFNNIAGTTRIYGRYVFEKDIPRWRELLMTSIEDNH